MKKLTSIFILLALTSILSAQEKMFHHISVANGLASNTVLCSVQDKDGFMWFGTKEGLCKYDGYDFQTSVGGTKSPLLSHRVRAIDVDDDGLLWITSVNGVGYLNTDNYETTTINAIPNDIYQSLLTDNLGNIWLRNQKIIISYNKYSGVLKQFPAEDYFSSQSAAKDSYGNVWFASSNGNIYTYKDNKFVSLSVSENESLNYIDIVNPTLAVILTSSFRLLHVDLTNGQTTELAVLPRTDLSFSNLCVKDNEYWVGGDKGIFIYNNDTGDLNHITNDSNNDFSLTCNSIKHLYADNAGNMWVSTYFDGINLNLNDQNSFIKLCIGNDNMNGQIVRAMYKHKNELWLGTEDGGLSIYDMIDGEIIDASYILDGKGQNIHNFAVKGNIMWISTYGNGIYTIDLETKKLVNQYLFGNNYISYITIANDGSVYATATNGLYHKTAYSNSFELIDDFSGSYLVGVFLDSNAGLWVMSDGNGLWYKSPTSSTFDNYRHNDGSGLPGDILFYCYEDKQERIWVTSEGGGIGYTSIKNNNERLSFTTFKDINGIPSNTTCAITEDNFSSLWLSTSRGLVELDSKSLEIKSLYNGLYRMNDYTFTNQAVHNANDGNIFFGTNKGFSYFDPREDISQDFPLHITYAYSGNKHKPISLSNNKPISLSEKGKFSFKEAQVITLHYAAINYPMQHSLLYEYQLKRKGWNLNGVTPENNVSFTNLKPGNYHFYVNLHGQEYDNDAQCYEFSIARPLYRSRVAVALFFLIAFTLIYFQYKNREKKVEKEKKRQLEIFEAKRQQSIYETKIDFYTQISHQLKTPLTLIKMPLEKILNEIDENNSLHKELLTVKTNADRLLELSNHLLYLRKSEKDKHDIKITRVNISEVVRKAYHSFDYILENSNINATLSLENKDIEILSSEDSVDKIVSNLIDNAIKYSKKSVKVSLSSDLVKGIIILRVESDGTPIQGEDRINIFKPFVRVKDSRTESGTGLGLSIALNLAEKLKGKLYLDDNYLDTNVFTLELPIRTETVPVVEVEAEVKSEVVAEAVAETVDSVKTVLLVEDSEDLLNYLANELSSEYKVLKAENGKVALDILKLHKVNMIVSDIMMPEVDGCELCNYTKTNIDYSHIPFIMISAASEQSETMERLKVGAEAYIEKPFNIDVLRSTINSLFKNKEISDIRLSNMPLSDFNNPSMSKVDTKFMNNVYSMVEDHLSDVNLSFEMLSDLTKTSKSTLYRKIKANTGLNVNEYIRLCRLKKAADMLISSDYKMDEIAFLVGFASSSYFSTCFKKQFSLTPSAFVKKYKNV